MSNVNVSGLVSGIDTDSIIEGLLDVQQRQLDQYTSRKTDVQAKQAAYKSLETQLLALRSAAGPLSRSTNNPFDARTVTVSHPDNLIATAASQSSAGTYQVRVNSLATAHQVASQGFSDPDAAITEGTFSIRVGAEPGTTITIDETNNTLSGLADSINFANVGVTASIVQDGSGALNSYRLLLTSSKTGESNAISITNDLAATGAGLTQPAFDFDNPVQAAADAQVSLGSGPGALSVSSATNTVKDLISGVTLNLLTADPDQPISVSVDADTESAKSAVSDFVDTYNSLLDFIDNVTKYDPESNTGAVLQGDYPIINIRTQLQAAIQSVVPGAPRTANRLSALGISTNDKGRLTINASELDRVVKGAVPGVTTKDLRKLFALDGTSTNGGVSYLLGSSKTQDSTTPYQVNITQAAERAGVTAASPVAASTVIDSSNNSLLLNLDEVEATITLADGTYTPGELATELERVINSHPDFIGRAISIGLTSSDTLTVTSDSYGASSRVTILSGSALTPLGFNGGESDAGVDVAGHFIVDGQVEAATGSGRILSGKSGNAHTDGLQVRVTLQPGQVTSGNEADLHVTRGITALLDELIGGFVDTETGILSSVDTQYSDQIESIQSSIDRQQTLFDKQKEDLLEQFNAMETALQQLQSTSSLLGSQLSSISSLKK